MLIFAVDTMKICDFGLSSMSNVHHGGTRPYMAPEMFEKVSKESMHNKVLEMAILYLVKFSTILLLHIQLLLL